MACESQPIFIFPLGNHKKNMFYLHIQSHFFSLFFTFLRLMIYLLVDKNNKDKKNKALTMENTNIYICTHKDFSVPQDLKGNYTIITDGTELVQQYPYPVTKADNELLPMKHSYSEGVMLYDVWKKDTTSQYIGINHYRRYLQSQFFDCEDENVLPMPFAFNLYAQYAGCHNFLDLLECKEIIEKYYADFNTNVQGFLPCNMAILEHSIYNEWCAFVFGVLEIFNERKHLYTDEDVRQYVAKYFPNNVDYQSRLNAFLMERLSTIFFANKFDGKPIRKSQIIMTNG